MGVTQIWLWRIMELSLFSSSKILIPVVMFYHSMVNTN